MIREFNFNYAGNDYVSKFAFALLLFSPLALMIGIAPFDIAISLLALLFVINSFIKNDFSWLQETWFKLFVILWAYMTIRGFFTIEPTVSVAESAVYLRFALLTLALQYWLLRSREARKALVISIIFVLIVAMVDGLIQLFIGNDLLGHHIILVDSSHSWRLSALSGKLNLGAKFSMIALPAIIYLVSLWKDKSLSHSARWLCLIIAVAFVSFIPLTGERNATLMILLGLALMFVFYKAYRLPIAGIMLFTLFFVMALAYLSPGFKQRGVDSINHISGFAELDQAGSTTNKNPYVLLLKTDWNIFLENPIFGVGRKQYYAYCEQAPTTIALTKLSNNQCITNPQNIYLEWLDETGIIGFGLFISIIVIWFRSFYRQRKLLMINPIALAALIEIFLRLWPIASTSSFFFSWCGGPFWLMAGWVFAYLSENKAQNL